MKRILPLLFVIGTIACSESNSTPPPTAPSSKRQSDDCSLCDMMDKFREMKPDPEPAAPDTTAEADTTQAVAPVEEPTPVEPAFPEGGDLNGDGVMDDEESREIEAFQQACREIATGIVYAMPSLVAGEGLNVEGLSIPWDRWSSRQSRAVIEFNGYGTAGLVGRINVSSNPAQAWFYTSPSDRSTPRFLIGTSLLISVQGRSVSIAGSFADVGKPAMTKIARPILLVFSYALETAFGSWNETIQGEHRGSISISGTKSSTWFFDDYAMSPQGVTIRGNISTGDVSTRRYPVDVWGSLEVFLPEHVARGKVAVVRTPPPPAEPVIDWASLLSTETVPSTIQPITYASVYINANLYKGGRAEGTMQLNNEIEMNDGRWYQDRIEYDIADLVAIPEHRAAFYSLPITTREQLLSSQ